MQTSALLSIDSFIVSLIASPGLAGMMAASFTSTAIEVYTQIEEMAMTDKEKRMEVYGIMRKIGKKGYVQFRTTAGELNLEVVFISSQTLIPLILPCRPNQPRPVLGFGVWGSASCQPFLCPSPSLAPSLSFICNGEGFGFNASAQAAQGFGFRLPRG